MRIVFMGTPEFAVPSLQKIHDAGYEIVGVVTAPDKPQGRGQKMRPSPVKVAAEALGIDNILQPDSVKDPLFAEEVRALRADVIVVVAFRILPPAVFGAASKGAFNLHGSLLPRYRGAAPIHHAVLNGDHETGVTTFFLKQKVDTGNILLRRSMDIGPDDTTGDVYRRMMELGATAVLETLRLIDAGNVAVEAQDNSLATPAPKVNAADAHIDWSKSAAEVHNHIRGYSPIPGAWTTLESSRVKIFRSTIPPNTASTVRDGPAGSIRVDDARILVSCSPGEVEVLDLQMEGRKRTTAAEFANGHRLESGRQFGQAGPETRGAVPVKR